MSQEHKRNCGRNFYIRNKILCHLVLVGRAVMPMPMPLTQRENVLSIIRGN